MRTLISIMEEIDQKVFSGTKISHGISHPVIRYEKGKYYLAVFAYLMRREYVENKTIERPCRWVLADLKSGEIENIISCDENDFSQAPKGMMYDMSVYAGNAPSENDVDNVYSMFESIRKKHIESDENIFPLAIGYLGALYKIVPKAYCRFYKELANI